VVGLGGSLKLSSTRANSSTGLPLKLFSAASLKSAIVQPCLSTMTLDEIPKDSQNDRKVSHLSLLS